MEKMHNLNITNIQSKHFLSPLLQDVSITGYCDIFEPMCGYLPHKIRFFFFFFHLSRRLISRVCTASGSCVGPNDELKTFNHAENQMRDEQFQRILIIVQFHSIIARSHLWNKFYLTAKEYF